MKPKEQDAVKASGHPLLKAAGLADSVGFQLRLAQAAVRADLIAALQPFGLRPGHYAALLILRATPGCRQQDIGEALAIQRPNLVAMIDGLERRGLLRREVNRADRRSYALTLTPDGLTLLGEAEAACDAHQRRLAARAGAGDAGGLLAMLRRVAAIGADAADAPPAADL